MRKKKERVRGREIKDTNGEREKKNEGERVAEGRTYKHLLSTVM